MVEWPYMAMELEVDLGKLLLSPSLISHNRKYSKSCKIVCNCEFIHAPLLKKKSDCGKNPRNSPGNSSQCGPLLLEKRWPIWEMKHFFELHLDLLEWKFVHPEP